MHYSYNLELILGARQIVGFEVNIGRRLRCDPIGCNASMRQRRDREMETWIFGGIAPEISELFKDEDRNIRAE